MMNIFSSKILISGALILTLLSSCTVYDVYKEQKLQSEKATTSAASAPKLSRATVDKSGLAMIQVTPVYETPGTPFHLAAFSQNEDVVSYGTNKRALVALRGGGLNSTYALGNNLDSIKPNPADPVQTKMPLKSWPTTTTRTYLFPGDDLGGRTLTVTCRYQAGEASRIEILEQTHDTQQMIEKCAGDVDFTNVYHVDSTGFIWRSLQWAGEQPKYLAIDVIEPLD